MNNTQQPQQSIRFAKKPVSRKRATKACLKCRKRKVRCDVTRTSTPCTNCRLDGCECVVARRADAFPLPDRRASVVSDNADLIRDCEAVTAAASTTSPPSNPTSPADDASTVLNTLEESAYPDSATHRDREDLESPTAKLSDAVEEIKETPYTPPVIQEPSEPVRSELKALYSSMPFLRTLNMRDCDFHHLNAQGCLRVPSKPILDEFIRHYFLYIHPLLPLINEADFWNAYDPTPNSATSGTPVSMLLLQSMMFASCTFVSKESLRTLGFATILEAKEAFYTKAKLLYDFSTDPDPISIAQSALLLTYWCPTFRSGPSKVNSRWLRIAIQHAKSCEADKYDVPSQGLHISQQDFKRRNILKRIWWCCIIRDRIMPLCVRRNIQITNDHFDFAICSPLGYDDLVDELDASRVYNIATKHKLILTLERLTELCVTLTDVLGLVYPTETLPILDAEAHSTAYAQVQEHKRSLKNWAVATRPPLALHDLRMSSGAYEDSAVLFTNLVWIYFHASQVALCNYELHLGLVLGLVTPNPTALHETQFLKNNRRDLRNATKSIAECFARLHPHRLTRWLPSSAVACTALPLAMHMVDVKMSSASSAAEIWSRPEVASKQSRLNVLIQVFRELHPKYDGVHSISKTIRYFMECSNLDEPTQLMLTNDHADVLARSPTQYLRLALTIDVCLSQDRLAQDSDFPAALRRFFRNRSFMPMLLGQPQFTPMSMSMSMPMTQQISLPRPLSPATYAKSFSRWMEDDPSVSFAMQMGLDIGPRSPFVYEVAERAQKSQSIGTEEPSLFEESQFNESVSSESQVNEPFTESVASLETTEDLLQCLQGAVSWAQNDQSLYFAQEMGLLSDGIGFNQGYL
ncbi:cutinase transcription factor 1 beta [Fusarium beomiforme]|uniref:Cutinase transcription factor 1 beta n=1 Tax=Fusarium beomiforme TaxID=44412 RepID=A0A9P5DRM7_9HYPO|nr:cutinase transcription factor 1 beta [Fusarium beomiforme]